MSGKEEIRLCIICRNKFTAIREKIGSQGFNHGHNSVIYTSEFGTAFKIDTKTYWFCNKCLEQMGLLK